MENRHTFENEETVFLNPFKLLNLYVPVMYYNDLLVDPKIIDEKLKIHSSMSYGINQSNNIDIYLQIEYYVELDSRLTILDVRLDAEFEISKIEDIIIKEGDNIRIPIDYIEIFVGILYGSLRGIIFEKTQGTLLNKKYLPLISSTDLISPLINRMNK